MFIEMDAKVLCARTSKKETLFLSKYKPAYDYWVNNKIYGFSKDYCSLSVNNQYTHVFIKSIMLLYNAVDIVRLESCLIL